jgi:hypothetical protein
MYRSYITITKHRQLLSGIRYSIDGMYIAPDKRVKSGRKLFIKKIPSLGFFVYLLQKRKIDSLNFYWLQISGLF